MALNRLDNNSSLNNAVDFANNIKSEIQTIKTALSSNLSNKKVTVSSSESLTSLVNKVNNINLGKKFASGTIKDKSYSARQHHSITVPMNLDFVPSYIIVEFGEITFSGEIEGVKRKYTISSKNNTEYIEGNFINIYDVYPQIFFEDVNRYSFRIKMQMKFTDTSYYIYLRNVKWYAFE